MDIWLIWFGKEKFPLIMEWYFFIYNKGEIDIERYDYEQLPIKRNAIASLKHEKPTDPALFRTRAEKSFNASKVSYWNCYLSLFLSE